MDIWSLDKIILFIAFFVPGFISIKAYQLFFPSFIRKTQDQLLDAIAYSAINYSLLFIPILSVENSRLIEYHPNIYYFFYFLVLFVSPIALVYFWKKIRHTSWFQNNAPHPTLKPWDYFFAQRNNCWVKVTLMNGAVIGGKFSSKSFASNAPAPEQIYLEESWKMNDMGGFDKIKEKTMGVIILSAEISTIEFYKLEY